MYQGEEDRGNTYRTPTIGPESQQPAVSLRMLRHQATGDTVSGTEERVTRDLENNVGELFDKGYRRNDVVECMDRFLNELQGEGVDFRGDRVKLDRNGHIVGAEDPRSTYSKYRVFDEYSKRELAWKSIDSRVMRAGKDAASGIGGMIKKAVDTIDDYVLEPIDECAVKPLMDGLYNAAAYAAQEAEHALDEVLLKFGVAVRPTINTVAFTGAGSGGECQITAEIEAYWNGKNIEDNDDPEEETLIGKISGFFSRIFG